MSQGKLKIGLVAGLAVVVLFVLVILRPGQPRERNIVAAKEEPQQATRPKQPRGGLTGGLDSQSTQSVTSEIKKRKTWTDWGLPELNRENADINPERPADMPLGEWEEYERLRQKIVEEKAYKFRETDPEKVVPYEVADIIPEAAKKYNVPQDLLAALLYTSSDGGHHYAQHDTEGGFGLMMLKESPQCNTLKEASDILGVDPEQVIYNQRLNVHGGAAVLRQYYEDALATGVSESEAWYMAVSTYSGRPQPELAQALADQVAGNLMKGFEIDSEDGSGYFKQEASATPLFQPKNWKVAGVDKPEDATADQKASVNNPNVGEPTPAVVSQ